MLRMTPGEFVRAIASRVWWVGFLFSLTGCTDRVQHGEAIRHTQAPLTVPGLVAAYGFDEVVGTAVVDATGSSHDTVLSGQTRVAGKYGNALAFELNRLTVPDDPALDFTTAFSLSAWVKPAHAPTGSHTILAKEAGGGLAYSLHASTELGDPGSYATVAGTEVLARSGEQLPTDEWSHVAATYDGSSLRVFVNGDEADATDATGTLAASSDPLSIGGNSTWGVYFSGALDEIRLYNRALSVAELRSDIHTPINPAAPDNSGPTVAFTLPANNARVAGPVAIRATANDNISVAAVKFFADGILLSEDTWPPFEAVWDSTSASVGAHTLSVEARDAAQNIGIATVTVTTVPEALVAAYAFDEGTGSTLHDVTGNGHDALLTNQSWVEGKFGTALAFTNDFITVTDSPLLDLTTGITLSAWIRPTGFPAIWPTIALKEKPGGLSYGLYSTWLDVEPALCVGALGGDDDCIFGGAAPIETWTHIAGTYDGADYRIYVNGELTSTASLSTPAGVSEEPLRIGGNSIWGEYFTGDIDELHIYARALAAPEIAVDMGAPLDCGSNIDDGNPCTTDACTSTTGVTHTPVPTGTSCDSDANLCNGQSTCNALGTCQAGTLPVLDDSNPCTADVCDPVLGVIHTALPASVICGDTNVCNGMEACNGSGSCIAGTPPAVDDGNPCTVDSCDSTAGVTHTPAAPGSACGNANACDGIESCDGSGVCRAGSAPNLDDGNPCTVDTCDAVSGINHTPAPAGTSCSNGVACDGAETCDASGTCLPGTPVDVADANPCTSDSCDRASGLPMHTPVAAGESCSDSNACNGLETCSATGVCQNGAPPIIDDLNECTHDSCDPVSGLITHAPAGEGTPCGGGFDCNAEGSCEEPPLVLDAPPLNPTQIPAPGAEWAFLYSGINPVQTGVAAGTIEPGRASLISGRVFSRDGSPITNAYASVAGEPKYGATRTREDGRFDLVVNGGGAVTIRLQKEGFLSSDRLVMPRWGTSASLPDVVLIQLDPVATVVTLDSAQTQVAAGSISGDSDGTRQGTLMVPPATHATVVLPDGSTQALGTATLRLTEYTVGERGSASMPAPLPPSTAYTYAVELSADEAIAAGGVRVEFDRPLSFYVENFLGFPVGQPVPAAFYDLVRRMWVPSANGVIIKVLTVSAGVAQVDITGDGIAESTAALTAAGFTAGELVELAARYSVGATLWRVPVTHFSPWDCNWPYGPPPNSKPLGHPPAPPRPDCGDGNTVGGSIIKCETQVLGERVEIPGTQFSINYRSNRAPGYKGNRQIRIDLTGPNVPPELKHIDVQVDLAGRRTLQRFLPQANLTTYFDWDGLDGFGRPQYGSATARIQVSAAYPATYYGAGFQFAASSPQPGVQISANRERAEVTYDSTFDVLVEGLIPTEGWGLGGWTLSENHLYDSALRKLYLGSGDTRSRAAMNDVVRIAGNGSPQVGPDGTEARNTGMDLTESATVRTVGFASAANGDVYIKTGLAYLSRISYADGKVYTVAGNGQIPCPAGFGDGGPATSARVFEPSDVAIGPDGSIFFADSLMHRVRRIRPDGTIETAAGGKPCVGSNISGGFAGDGGQATLAFLNRPNRIAVGVDGTLFIFDSENRRIRKVATNGIITTFAGNGNIGPYDRILHDYKPGTAVPMSSILDIAASPDGTLYAIADRDLLAIRPDGVVHTTTASWHPSNRIDDGVQLSEEAVGFEPGSVAVDAAGTIFFMDNDRSRDLKYDPLSTSTNTLIRSVDPSGVVTTIASGPSSPTVVADGSIALGKGVPGGPNLTPGWLQIAPAPDGSILYADNRRIYRARGGSPKACGSSQIAVPVNGNDEVYCFDQNGKHLRTLDIRTNATLYQFGYTGGKLSSVTDSSGNVTTISYGAEAITIVAPFGQTTTIDLDASGNTVSIDNGVTAVSVEPRADGLLSAFIDERGLRHEFDYSPQGFLIHDEAPDGALQQLARTSVPGGHRVERSTALGRTTTYELTRDASGLNTSTLITPSALATVSKLFANGKREVRYPDGTIVTSTEGSDPRFWLHDPFIATETTTLPSGLAMNVTEARTATLSNPLDPFSMTAESTATSLNGRTWTTNYTASNRTFVTTSPAGRTLTRVIDASGRPIRVQVPGIVPLEFGYDTAGRLQAITQVSGAVLRSTSFGYTDAGPARGYLATVTDAKSDVTTATRDALGRPFSVTRGLTTTGFTWDPAGNLTSVTPPGRPAHSFTYTAGDLLETYSPPPSGLPVFATSYTYDLDRFLISETLATGTAITRSPDAAGRVDTTDFVAGLLKREYYGSAVSGAGRTSDVRGPNGVDLHLTYDGALMMSASWSGTVTGSVAWQYNTDFNTTRETVAGTTGSSFATFGYDNDQLLTCASPTSCTTPSADALLLNRSAPGGLVGSIVLGGTNESLGYSNFGELARQQATFSGSPIVDITYDAAGAERDLLGRVAQKTEIIGGVTNVFRYTYDTLRRLTDVTVNSVLSEHYEYDNNGNRVLGFSSQTGVTSTGVYDDQDRLSSYGPLAFTYSAHGELATKTNLQNGAAWALAYDALGNLRSVTLPDGRLVEYLVDGVGRRVAKKVDGVTVKRWIYRDRLKPVAELDGSGTLVAQFVYGSKANVPDLVIRGANLYRVISDQLGSARYVVNVANPSDVPYRADYSAFGQVSGSGLDWMPFGFAGGHFDPDTGLVRFGARDYDPSVGRWTAKDPLVFEGNQTNLFAYVANDPVNLLDFDGRFFNGAAATGASAGTGVGAAGGAAVGAAGAAGFAFGYYVLGPLIIDPIFEAINEADREAFARDVEEFNAEHSDQEREDTVDEHRKKTPSKWDKHTKRRSSDPEKGDENRDPRRKRPPNHRGPWPKKNCP